MSWIICAFLASFFFCENPAYFRAPIWKLHKFQKTAFRIAGQEIINEATTSSLCWLVYTRERGCHISKSCRCRREWISGVAIISRSWIVLLLLTRWWVVFGSASCNGASSTCPGTTAAASATTTMLLLLLLLLSHPSVGSTATVPCRSLSEWDRIYREKWVIFIGQCAPSMQSGKM